MRPDGQESGLFFLPYNRLLNADGDVFRLSIGDGSRGMRRIIVVISLAAAESSSNHAGGGDDARELP